MLLLVQSLSIILIILADRLSKLWAVNFLEPIGKIEIVRGVFNLRYVENTGAAFSMLQGKTILLTMIPLLACIAMAYVLVTNKIKSRMGTWGISLILAGAIGNLIDRLFRGAVVDMFDFAVIHFPVFNVADIAVTVGAVMFFIYVIFFYEGKTDKKDG